LKSHVTLKLKWTWLQTRHRGDREQEIFWKVLWKSIPLFRIYRKCIVLKPFIHTVTPFVETWIRCSFIIFFTVCPNARSIFQFQKRLSVSHTCYSSHNLLQQMSWIFKLTKGSPIFGQMPNIQIPLFIGVKKNGWFSLSDIFITKLTLLEGCATLNWPLFDLPSN